MHLRDWSAALATLVVGAGLTGWIGQVTGQQPALQLSAPQNGAAGANGGVMEDGTAMTRGPIHEAFAEVVNYNPEPTIVVEKQPPGAIEELPPDQKPEGEGHLWIPGYWAWAEDRSDYIWISGVWRAPPPNTQWVPGYWSEVQNGWQWIPGYWQPVNAQPDQDQLAGVEAEEVEYLPEPPPSLEQGAPSPQPSQDHFWVPGHWYWYQARYVWRPGYWAVMVPDWVWVPSRYVWTPNGCIFVPGHWDIVMQRRGLVFAPVYFEPAVYARPRFTYMPRIVLSANVFNVHLFCRPRYYHYYFGDYYDPGYERYGIMPWFTYHEYRHGYEPFFVYNRWYYHRHHHNDWEQRLRRWHHYRVEHEDFRPPHTFVEMRRLAARHRTGPDVVVDNRTVINNNTVINNVFATTIEDASQRNDLDIRLVRLDEDRRERMVQLREGFQNISSQRREVEVRSREQEPSGERKSPRRVALPGVREMRQVVADATGTAETPQVQMPSKPPSTADEARTLRETVLANRQRGRGPRSPSPESTERRPQPDSAPASRTDGTTTAPGPSAVEVGPPDVTMPELPELPDVPDAATSTQSDRSGSERPERARTGSEDIETRTSASGVPDRGRSRMRDGQAGQTGAGRTARPQLPGGVGQVDGKDAANVAGPGTAGSPAAPEGAGPALRDRRTGREGANETSDRANPPDRTPDMSNPSPPSRDASVPRPGQVTTPDSVARPETGPQGESAADPVVPSPRRPDTGRAPAPTTSGEGDPAARPPAATNPDVRGRFDRRDNAANRAAIPDLTPDMTNPSPPGMTTGPNSPANDNSAPRTGRTALPGGAGRPETGARGESNVNPVVPGPRLPDMGRTPAPTASGEVDAAARLPAATNPDVSGRSNWRGNAFRPEAGNASGGTRRPSLSNRPWATDSSSPLGNPAATPVPRTENLPSRTRLPEADSRPLQNRSTQERAAPAARQPNQTMLPNMRSAQPSTDSGRGRSSRETTPRIQQDSRSFQQMPQQYRSTPSASSSRRYELPTQSVRPSTPSVGPSRSEARSSAPAPRFDRSTERSGGNRFERSSGSSSERSSRGSRGRGRGDD